MKAARAIAIGCALGIAVFAGPGAPAAGASTAMISRLARPVVPVPPPPPGLLAQRAIDREWGLSEDSTYRSVDVPGWKSEGAALSLSGVVPGAGQLYAGETSGWLYVLAEAAGWTGRWLAHRKADRYLRDAERFVGDPNDSSAAFSFARYHAATGGSAGDLEQLWQVDRNAYYRALASDPAYLPGFGGSRPADALGSFTGLLEQHDTAAGHVRLVETALWLNHLVSAVDALRAARFHNLPLRQQYQLQLGERLRHGRPELRAAIVRRF
jgi:hypothetical protein